MNTLARVVYGLFGGIALLLGFLALVRPQLALQADEVSSVTTHLVREQAAAWVFIGMMALWCLFRFERRRPVHLALLVFTALFAAIHWSEYFYHRRQLTSPLVNSAPFLALAATLGREPRSET